MSQVFTADGVDLGTEAVRAGAIPGFVTNAELGSVGMSQVVIDNPDGTVTIGGLKPFTVDELAETAGDQRYFTGRMNERTYKRRVGSSLITGPANEIAIALSDLNVLLTDRIITEGVRPSETITARTAWLLAFLNGLVVDNGFVNTNATVLDGADFTGQKPTDVLADMALYVGWNYFVYYNEPTDEPSLWLQNSNTSSDWDSGIFITNDLALIDNAAIVAGTATVFYALLDAAMIRNPARVYSGAYLPFAKGFVYETDPTIESNFVARDGSAPNSNVKTAATATTIAQRFLAENDTEDDRITCTIQVAASQVNVVKAGQLVQGKFLHFPGYDTGTYFRVMKQTTAQPEVTDQMYRLTLELSPATPELLTPTFAMLMRPNDSYFSSSPLQGLLGWSFDGDTPKGGDPLNPKYGLVDYYPIGSKPTDGWTALIVGGDGTLDSMRYRSDGIFVCDGSITVTGTIRVNGGIVGSSVYASSGSLRFDGPGFDFTATDVVVASGDIIEGWMTCTGNVIGGITVPAGLGEGSQQLSIIGGLV